MLALLPASAGAYTVADTVGDGSGEELRWPDGEPVPFRVHFRGSDDLPDEELSRLLRASMATWAEVPGAEVTFEEGLIYTGPAAHHGGPTEVDGQSAIFFIEGAWPFGPEVIALTSVSFASDGEILDADIAFNGDDHTFTTVDQGGAKDFVSITTHEVGHFLGLAHSDDPGATMTAEYEDGQIGLRDLNADDEEGISYLYPCPGAQCVGDVGWRARKGCASGGAPSGGGGGAWALLLVGVGVLVVRRRSAAVAALALGVMIVSPADGSLVRELPVAALSQDADQVVRGVVTEVRTALEGGVVTTRATVQVTERWQGEGLDEVQLVLPGGVLDEPVTVWGPDGEPLRKQLAGTLVFGAPRVSVGEEIVAAVEHDGTVRGMAQGLFHVTAGGAVSRDLEGLAFARVRGEAPLPVVAPESVDALRVAMQVEPMR